VEDIIQIEEEDDDFIKRELANNLQEDPITEPQHRYIKNTIEVDVNEILHARKEPAVRKIYKERFSVIHTLETQKKSCGK
ncbi:Hypothetical protein CINCED_3A016595, partial [Cinara cedri]